MDLELEHLKTAVEKLTVIVTQLVEERSNTSTDTEKPTTAEQKAIEDKEIQDFVDKIPIKI